MAKKFNVKGGKWLDPPEEWRDIPGLENQYQVSNWGNIKSLDRKKLYSSGKVHYLKGKILKPNLRVRGKRKSLDKVFPFKNGPKNMKISVLVARAFHGHIPNGLNIVVDHKDNNPLNNKVYNLQLITQFENNRKDKLKKFGYNSDYLGVSKNKNRFKRGLKRYWVARCHDIKPPKFLGYFESEEEANQAINKYRKEILHG